LLICSEVPSLRDLFCSYLCIYSLHLCAVLILCIVVNSR
jgi:hypothetical protein